MSLIKKPTSSSILEAAEIIKAGNIACFPTETIYGLAVLAENETAVKKLFAAKSRAENKPLQIMFPNISAAGEHVMMTKEIEKLAEKFLPGRLTIIATKNKNSNISSLALSSGNSIGIRIPANEAAIQILRNIDAPVAATSANISGNKPLETAFEIEKEFGKNLAIIIDGRKISGLPSTVIDMRGAAPKILRQGSISKEQIEQVVGRF